MSNVKFLCLFYLLSASSGYSLPGITFSLSNAPKNIGALAAGMGWLASGSMAVPIDNDTYVSKDDIESLNQKVDYLMYIGVGVTALVVIKCLWDCFCSASKGNVSKMNKRLKRELHTSIVDEMNNKKAALEECVADAKRDITSKVGRFYVKSDAVIQRFESVSGLVSEFVEASKKLSVIEDKLTEPSKVNNEIAERPTFKWQLTDSGCSVIDDVDMGTEKIPLVPLSKTDNPALLDKGHSSDPMWVLRKK